MSKTVKNEIGAGAVVVILVIIIIGLIGVLGYMVMKKQNTTTNTTTTSNTTNNSRNSTNTDNSKLTISQWGVTLDKTTPINDATYRYVISSSYDGHPAAYLSTKDLDGSSTCTAYYSQYDTSADRDQKTFQAVVQYKTTDTTSLDEGETTITALQASQKDPIMYIRVGDNVYRYVHGNGSPCQAQTQAMTDAFTAAFATIAAKK